MQANAITSPRPIRPGQRLVIPRYDQAASAPRTAGQSEHVVGPGETMTGIAKRYNVPLKDLRERQQHRALCAIEDGRPAGHSRTLCQRQAAGGKPATAAPAQAARRPSRRQPPAQQGRGGARKRSAAAPPQRPRCSPRRRCERRRRERLPAPLPAFRWPVRGRIIAGFGPKPNGHKRRHQSRGAGRHAGQGGGRRRRRLCGQRAEGLRQSRPGPPSERLSSPPMRMPASCW